MNAFVPNYRVVKAVTTSNTSTYQTRLRVNILNFSHSLLARLCTVLMQWDLSTYYYYW